MPVSRGVRHGQYLSSDVAGQRRGRKPDVAGQVVDDFFQLLDGHPIADRDREVELQLLAGAQRNERPERDEAARAAIQPGPGPQRAEYMVEAQVAEFSGETLITHAGEVIRDQPG